MISIEHCRSCLTWNGSYNRNRPIDICRRLNEKIVEDITNNSVRSEEYFRRYIRSLRIPSKSRYNWTLLIQQNDEKALFWLIWSRKSPVSLCFEYIKVCFPIELNMGNISSAGRNIPTCCDIEKLCLLIVQEPVHVSRDRFL